MSDSKSDSNGASSSNSLPGTKLISDIIPVVRAQGSFDFEYTVVMTTSESDYWTKPINTIPRIVSLIELYASVNLEELSVEVAQMTLVGSVSSYLHSTGSCYVSVIPSRNDTEAKCGSNTSVIMTVPRKRVIPLSSVQQVVTEHKLDITGFENDLAQDARRGQAPIMWFGNTGVKIFKDGGVKSICSLTWRGRVKCEGVSALW